MTTTNELTPPVVHVSTEQALGYLQEYAAQLSRELDTTIEVAILNEGPDGRALPEGSEAWFGVSGPSCTAHTMGYDRAWHMLAGIQVGFYVGRRYAYQTVKGD